MNTYIIYTFSGHFTTYLAGWSFFGYFRYDSNPLTGDLEPRHYLRTTRLWYLPTRKADRKAQMIESWWKLRVLKIRFSGSFLVVLTLCQSCKVSTRKDLSPRVLNNIFLLLVGRKPDWNWAIFCEMRDIPNCWHQRRCSGCFFDHDEFIQFFLFGHVQINFKFLAWLFLSPKFRMSLDRESWGWDPLLKCNNTGGGDNPRYNYSRWLTSG